MRTMQNFTRQCKVPEKGRVTVSNFGAKVINFGAYPGGKDVKRQDAKGTHNERKWFLRFLFGKKTLDARTQKECARNANCFGFNNSRTLNKKSRS